MIYIFLGVPGSGKGTIAKELVEKYHFLHLSTGDIFRKNIKNKTELGIKLKNLIDSGKLVDDKITNKIASDEIISYNNDKNLILDGYPRTVSQMNYLIDFCKENKISLGSVVYFDINKDVVIKRLSNRLVSKNGNVYNSKIHKIENIDGKFYSPKGEELFYRDDDKEENIKIRFQEYMEKTFPLVNYCKDLEVIKSINADSDHTEVMNQVLKIVWKK